MLRQPHLPPIRGKATARAEFERLFGWFPALRAIAAHRLSPRQGAVAKTAGFP